MSIIVLNVSNPTSLAVHGCWSFLILLLSINSTFPVNFTTRNTNTNQVIESLTLLNVSNNQCQLKQVSPGWYQSTWSTNSNTDIILDYSLEQHCYESPTNRPSSSSSRSFTPFLWIPVLISGFLLPWGCYMRRRNQYIPLGNAMDSVQTEAKERDDSKLHGVEVEMVDSEPSHKKKAEEFKS